MTTKNKALLRTLIEMHGYCRPMGSATETDFIDRYIATLPGAEEDMHGNWHVTVSDDPILWSCHTDTVHAAEGMQQVAYSRKTGMLTLAKNSKSSCLGADDTAGVFLCREMILAKVPGHYVFHYGEERGGIGSRALANSGVSFLSMFKFAIALDRQGHGDIITHQGMGRTASDAFANSLAAQLGGYYEASPNGIYTDTEEYCDIIPECSNVSIGYTRAHSRMEALDTKHVLRLLAALKKIDVSQLVCERDPLDARYTDYGSAWDTESSGWQYMYDPDADKYVRIDSGKKSGNTKAAVDFLDAEWVTRQDALLNEAAALDYCGSRLDDYLDPTWGQVQAELRRQLAQRTRH